MTVKTLTFAAAIALLPTLSFAGGCSYGSKQQAMSCAAGTSYDSATHSCQPVTT